MAGERGEREPCIDCAVDEALVLHNVETTQWPSCCTLRLGRRAVREIDIEARVIVCVEQNDTWTLRSFTVQLTMMNEVEGEIVGRAREPSRRKYGACSVRCLDPL